MSRKPHLPTLNWLRTFESAARHMSFTTAAAELNLTQAAVSQQIKLLEHYLCQPLFQRMPRGLQLTEAGKSYLPKVKDALDRLGMATQEVFGQVKEQRVRVRVSGAFGAWLMARLPDFHSKFPDVELRLARVQWVPEVRVDDYDLEIRWGPGVWAEAEVIQLTHAMMQPTFSPALLEGEHPLTSAENMQHHRLIHLTGTMSGWSDWFQQAGLPPEQLGSGDQMDASDFCQMAAVSGLGVMLGLDFLVSEDVKAGRLVQPFGPAIPSGENFYLVKPKNSSLSPAAQNFSDWLMERLAEEQA